MLEILQFYVSGFWVWAGISIGIWIVGVMLIYVVAAFAAIWRR